MRTGPWRIVIGLVRHAEDIVHLGVAMLLTAVTGYVLYETAHDFLFTCPDFAVRVSAGHCCVDGPRVARRGFCGEASPSSSSILRSVGVRGVPGPA